MFYFENQRNKILHHEIVKILESNPEPIMIVSSEPDPKILFENKQMKDFVTDLKLENDLNKKIFQPPYQNMIFSQSQRHMGSDVKDKEDFTKSIMDIILDENNDH